MICCKNTNVFVSHMGRVSLLKLCHGEKTRMKMNVFVSHMGRVSLLKLCHGEKTRMKMNVFVSHMGRVSLLKLCHGEKTRDRIRHKDIFLANHNFQLSTFNSQLFYSSVTPQFSVSSTRCAFSIVRNVPFTPVGSPLTVYE